MTKKELKECLKIERKRAIGEDDSLKHILYLILTHHPSWLRWRFIKYMRKSNEANNIVKKLWYKRKKCAMGNKLGYEINGWNIGKGFTIYHNGPVVINGLSILGENCSLHGDNCIGNDGITGVCPTIGNNVDIGVGAKIIGDVHIADNCVIGAGAVVVSDFTEPGSIIGGVPARKLK